MRRSDVGQPGAPGCVGELLDDQTGGIHRNRDDARARSCKHVICAEVTRLFYGHEIARLNQRTRTKIQKLVVNHSRPEFDRTGSLPRANAGGKRQFLRVMRHCLPAVEWKFDTRRSREIKVRQMRCGKSSGQGTPYSKSYGSREGCRVTGFSIAQVLGELRKPWEAMDEMPVSEFFFFLCAGAAWESGITPRQKCPRPCARLHILPRSDSHRRTGRHCGKR